jgi:hypothetical protein
VRSVRTLISCIPLRATVPTHIISPDNRRIFLNKTKRQLYVLNRHTFAEDIAIEQVGVYHSYECIGAFAHMLDETLCELWRTCSRKTEKAHHVNGVPA